MEVGFCARPPGEEVEGQVFMLVNYDRGPIASTLYRFQVPSILSQGAKRADSIDTFLEFPSADFPRDMCCVQLRSKLYLFGGHFDKGSAPSPPNEGKNLFPLDVHAIDLTVTTNQPPRCPNITKCLKPMNAGKPLPYACKANGRIFVYDNSNTHTFGNRPSKSLFEVFEPDPEPGQWKKLPPPPDPSVVVGHGVVRGKLFLSCTGESGDGHILCFDLLKDEWIQNFVHSVMEGHKFYGQAQLLNDTLYAISGNFGYCPSAYYNFTPKLVEDTLRNCSPQLEDFECCDTVVFDSVAFVATTFKGVHSLVVPDWLSGHLVYLSNKSFCYVRYGLYPTDDYPEYVGVDLGFFKPRPGIFTEVLHGSNFTSFTGELLQSSHLKITTADDPDSYCPDYGYVKNCFYVSNKILGRGLDIKTRRSRLVNR